MTAKSFYLHQAQLCMKLAEVAPNPVVAERLRTLAADYFDKGHEANEAELMVHPDAVVWHEPEQN